MDSKTAAEYVKSRLPEALKQHLQDYEKDKENSVLSYQTILEQQILSIDREMLEKLTVSYDEAVNVLVSRLCVLSHADESGHMKSFYSMCPQEAPECVKFCSQSKGTVS
ncbi:Protein phosphatase 1L [Myotis brandtii]|uniref:Protein phosphatase 1L n=1 Tax=Myotis brandtii TaxID=109478 RepID=S7MT05_MYOBR|nr:Protein phosphatase 1L [Myotis brandtii]